MKKEGRFRAAVVFSDRGLETLSTIRGDHSLGTRVILDQGERIRQFANELGRRARELAAERRRPGSAHPGQGR